MRNREKQREPRRKYGKRTERMVSYYNHERYADPTAFMAINNVVRESRGKSRLFA